MRLAGSLSAQAAHLLGCQISIRCAAYARPWQAFNFTVGIEDISFTATALANAGVKRISLATSLYSAAMTGLLNAAKESRERYFATSTPRSLLRE
jgi:2-methylisocitrate lyase-like PEP mutase family enzyme